MHTPWRMVLLACAVATTVGCALANASWLLYLLA